MNTPGSLLRVWLTVRASEETVQLGPLLPSRVSEKSSSALASTHSQPSSTAQLLSQPSPFVVLPSSQSSVEESHSPSPHVAAWASDTKTGPSTKRKPRKVIEPGYAIDPRIAAQW